METNNKLREALTQILNLTNSLDEDCAVDPVEIRDIAKAAPAEPVKNCEVGTAQEQLERLNAYCKKCDGCMSYTRPELLDEVCLCALKWAQMPYEEGVDK